MKIFKRTKSGLNNLYLFFGVDLVVYLEGGSRNYSFDEVKKGNYNEDTVDIIFWERIFQEFKPNIKIKFKSVGSKTTVDDIAKDIIVNNISTSMVAMDSEFDEVFNKRHSHPNVLYTYGYSFENDIWSENIIKEIIHSISATKPISKDIKDNISKFIKKIKIGVFADGYLFKNNSSFFQRPNGYMRNINCSPLDLPNVKTNEIGSRIIQKGLKKASLYYFGRKYSIEVLKHCYGHLLADYCFQLIMHYLKNRLSLPTLRSELILRMAIKVYFDKYFRGSKIFLYYQNQF
jgi:hypothetical protein